MAAAPPIDIDRDYDRIIISKSMEIELNKIGAEYTAKDGVKRSYEEIILLLIDEYKKCRKNSKE